MEFSIAVQRGVVQVSFGEHLGHAEELDEINNMRSWVMRQDRIPLECRLGVMAQLEQIEARHLSGRHAITRANFERIEREEARRMRIFNFILTALCTGIIVYIGIEIARTMAK